MRPADLPSAAHFAALPCGTRAKYVAGVCRCLRCRAANATYATLCARRKRDGWSGRLVAAAPARAHLLALSTAGVGRRAVQAACDVGLTVLSDIRQGRKTQIREATARRILAVTREALSDHAVIPAGATRRRLRVLLAEGFTKTELARRLGSRAKTPALQITGAHVLARTASKVERFYRIVMAGATTDPKAIVAP